VIGPTAARSWQEERLRRRMAGFPWFAVPQPLTAAEVDTRRRLAALPYREYLQTKYWRARRSRALRLAHFRCQACGSPRRLEVHHRTYARRGREADADLVVLCGRCHRRRHQGPS
jgi:5-methylcytosine-specific restriction endonuclease McrA